MSSTETGSRAKTAQGTSDQPESEQKGYKGLRVWHSSMELVDQVYDVTGEMPSSERFGLTRQLRDAAVSIPSNIAEGHVSGSLGLYLRRIRDACGSAAEVETQLRIAGRQQFVSSDELESMLELLTEIRKALFSLRRYLAEHPDR